MNPMPTDTASPSVDTRAPLEARALSASLTVRDVRASRDWYRDALGFAVDRTYERDGALRGVAMQAGAVRLLLNQDDGALGAERVKGAGFSLMISTTRTSTPRPRNKGIGQRLDSEPENGVGCGVFRGAIRTGSARHLVGVERVTRRSVRPGRLEPGSSALAEAFSRHRYGWGIAHRGTAWRSWAVRRCGTCGGDREGEASAASSPPCPRNFEIGIIAGGEKW